MFSCFAILSVRAPPKTMKVTTSARRSYPRSELTDSNERVGRKGRERKGPGIGKRTYTQVPGRQLWRQRDASVGIPNEGPICARRGSEPERGTPVTSTRGRSGSCIKHDHRRRHRRRVMTTSSTASLLATRSLPRAKRIQPKTKPRRSDPGWDTGRPTDRPTRSQACFSNPPAAKCDEERKEGRKEAAIGNQAPTLSGIMDGPHRAAPLGRTSRIGPQPWFLRANKENEQNGPRATKN